MVGKKRPSNPGVSEIVKKRRAERLAQKEAAAKKKLDKSKAPKGAIDPVKLYTRGALAVEFGLGKVWFREAQKLGLKSHRAGRVKFVLGKDLIKFITSGKGAAITPRPKPASID